MVLVHVCSVNLCLFHSSFFIPTINGSTTKQLSVNQTIEKNRRYGITRIFYFSYSHHFNKGIRGTNPNPMIFGVKFFSSSHS